MKKITREILIPDWVGWIAQDADGSWFMYQTKPDSSLQDEYWTPSSGEYGELHLDEPNENWAETLEKVEHEQPRKAN